MHGMNIKITNNDVCYRLIRRIDYVIWTEEKLFMIYCVMEFSVRTAFRYKGELPCTYAQLLRVSLCLRNKETLPETTLMA